MCVRILADLFGVDLDVFCLSVFVGCACILFLFRLFCGCDYAVALCLFLFLRFFCCVHFTFIVLPFCVYVCVIALVCLMLLCF